MIAVTSGSLGDIVYALVLLKRMKVKTLYVKESNFFPPYGNLYTAIKDIVEMQGIECLPTDSSYPPFKFDPKIKFQVNLDNARNMPNRGKVHIIINYLKDNKLKPNDWTAPWLRVEGPRRLAGKYILFQVTERWRDNSKVDWTEVIREIAHLYPIPAYFIGFESEFIKFKQATGMRIEWVPTANVLEMAILIRDCFFLACNQSVGLTLAQGLGKDYMLEVKPGKTNTIMQTPNEIIIR